MIKNIRRAFSRFDCGFCGEGRLYFANFGASLYLVCEECEAVYTNPPDLRAVVDDFLELRVSYPLEKDLIDHPWHQYFTYEEDFQFYSVQD